MKSLSYSAKFLVMAVLLSLVLPLEKPARADIVSGGLNAGIKVCDFILEKGFKGIQLSQGLIDRLYEIYSDRQESKRFNQVQEDLKARAEFAKEKNRDIFFVRYGGRTGRTKDDVYFFAMENNYKFTRDISTGIAIIFVKNAPAAMPDAPPYSDDFSSLEQSLSSIRSWLTASYYRRFEDLKNRLYRGYQGSGAGDGP